MAYSRVYRGDIVGILWLVVNDGSWFIKNEWNMMEKMG